MYKKKFNPKAWLCILTITYSSAFYAQSTLDNNIIQPSVANNNPVITPAPPPINAKAYILIDVDSGKIIAERNSEQKMPPASLTKIMTLYVVSNALSHDQIHLSDPVRISQEAWKIGGSRMFVKEGQQVSVEDLLKGIIVDSGNDACVAMAEHLGSSESSFTEIMNHQARQLGMVNSHFTDSTGLPNPDHYTTAKDLAILSRSLINDFPQYYHWYKQKWFTFNGIRQPNRNRLLWRDSFVDGIKTGHTNEAGFCLVASAKRNNMRLLAVVLNSPTDNARADDSERLLNYGFRFFETHPLYDAGQPISTVKLYKSKLKALPIGLTRNQSITIPAGQYQRLTMSTQIPKYSQAPIKKGDHVGDLIIKFDNNIISTIPLQALQDAEKSGMFSRMIDSVRLAFARWF
jgi:serine-type D-Ala-D-Ala carboxypeptidase (penicillin-binding protein 5/6)